MSGYLSGLSSPSVTERMTTLCASPRSNAAGQTRLPTFSIRSRLPSAGCNVVRACPTMCASRWQPLPVLTCTADAIGIERGLLVAFDHRDRNAASKRLDRAHEERRLARAGARHQIQCKDALIAKYPPVERRERIVLREDVLLDLHDARARETGTVMSAEAAGGAEPMVVRASAIVDMAVPRTVRMAVRMRSSRFMLSFIDGHAVDP